MPGPSVPGRGYPVVAGEAARFARTVIQLRPAQAGPRPGPAAGWPAGFTPLDARAWHCWPGGAALYGGEMGLLGVSRTLAPASGQGMVRWAEADWEMRDAPLLWRYHLYYWDWAWALAASEQPAQARELFTAMWSSWRAAVTAGTGPAWHPYPVALRAWSFCGIYRALVEGGPVEGAFRAELAAH